MLSLGFFAFLRFIGPCVVVDGLRQFGPSHAVSDFVFGFETKNKV